MQIWEINGIDMYGTKDTKNKFKKRKKKNILKFVENHTKICIARTNLSKKKSNVRSLTSITIVSLKIYYRAIIIRTI